MNGAIEKRHRKDAILAGILHEGKNEEASEKKFYGKEVAAVR
jgi:hypothetical protein